MRTLRSSETLHRAVWDLIPWVVNGRASATELALVDRHARVCEACGEELEFQRRLHFAMALESGKTRDPVAGFRGLEHRIAHASGAERAIAHDFSSPVLASPRRGLAMRVLVASVIIEAAGLLILGGVLLVPDRFAIRTPEYRTLASAPSSTRNATIRVVWAPSATAEQMQSILRRLGLEAVSGPSEAGVYSLSTRAPNSDLALQLAQLRADANVLFAEPVPPAAGGP